jgi:small subunit ribosomal protein S19
MGRSKWKGPYIDPKFIDDLNNLNKKKSLPIISRNSSIIPKFIGLKFKVHTGKTFLEITVSKAMVGHKFGEFTPTRAKFSFKKKKRTS